MENYGGQIITFYSYKGGVGRSMSLANVAYIAAMNAQRVLVMDWDLEAPGIAYYFRGLVEPQQSYEIKTAPGILDLVWNWVETIRGEPDQAKIQNYIESTESGVPFGETVRTIFDESFGGGGRLDILRAGSDRIGGKLSYEEALSVFSWPDFFEKDAGGLFIHTLRQWAKKNYDFVLIDSRTGLADVAGVCTMQLPDIVALCFILNRQNMEGVARVSGTIRSKREEEVKLRAVPMRIASRGTSEEASARARARRELIVQGGFSADVLDDDFSNLSVEASPNVPFYEALAPTIANDPMKDPLSQNYLQLASEVLGRNFSMPMLQDELAERIKRRLQPRHATADYILDLQESDPERAYEEIEHLIESALDAQLEHDEDLEDKYVEALARAAFDVADEVGTYEGINLIIQATDLARARYLDQGRIWLPLFVEALEKQLEYASFMGDLEGELVLLEEVDSLLSSDPTISTRLKRLRLRRRLARVQIQRDEPDAAFQALAEVQSIIESLSDLDLASDQIDQKTVAEVDTYLLRGDVYAQREDDTGSKRAVAEFWKGYERSASFGDGRSELSRLRYDFAVRLAVRFPDLVPNEKRALLALEAARVSAGQSYSWFVFTPLASAILDEKDSGMLLAFIEYAIPRQRLSLFATYQARHPTGPGNFFRIATDIVQSLRVSNLADWREAVERLGQASIAVLGYAMRRRATVSRHDFSMEIVAPLKKLTEVYEIAGFPNISAELSANASQLKVWNDKSNRRHGAE